MKPAFILRGILTAILLLTGLLLSELWPSKNVTQGLLAGIGLLAMMGFFFVKNVKVTPQETDLAQEQPGVPEPETITITDPEFNPGSGDLSLNPQSATVPVPKREKAYDNETIDVAERYLLHFYKKYKSFYGDIQRIPVEPDDIQAQHIKRQLVEMGIHALSFARAAKLKKLKRPNDEPNILLILEQLPIDQLDRTSYRLYTDDPYKTEKRYHILRKIFQEMDLDHLDVLTETVYISPEFLKKP